MKLRSGGPPEPVRAGTSRGDGNIAATIGERGFRRWHEWTIV